MFPTMCWPLLVATSVPLLVAASPFESSQDSEYGIDVGYEEIDHSVSELRLPVFSSKPQNILVAVGETLELPCVFKETPYSRIVKKMPDDADHADIHCGTLFFVEDIQLKRDHRLSLINNVIKLTNVSMEDAGEYLCYFQSEPNVELRHTVKVQAYRPTDPFSAGCLSVGGHVFEDQCLIFHMDKYLSWFAAKDACAAKDQVLASDIHNLQGLVDAINADNDLRDGYGFWTGGSDIASEGSWEWVGGRAITGRIPWDVLNLMGSTLQNCLRVDFTGYYDEECFYRRRYICAVDIDECANQNVCQQLCHNSDGSYTCSCYEGYSINADGKTCQAPTCEPSCLRGICLAHNSCGCDRNITNDQCQKEFYSAARDGDLPFIKGELGSSSRINLNWSNKGDGDRTSLYVAAEKDRPSVVRVLCDAGADPNMKVGRNGYSPVYIAAALGHNDVLSILLEPAYRADVNKVTTAGWSPLMTASEYGHLDTARALIKAGAQINYVRPSSGNTALHFAARYNHLDIALLLLQNAADKNKKTKAGYTPADVSRYFGDGSVARLIDNY